jgi:hypothetical protein
LAGASLDVCMSSDNAKRREVLRSQRLEWQGELESHMADLDVRLEHPRRRATDAARQPTLPDLGQAEITSELLDEIAWRVAEQIRVQRAPAPSLPGASAKTGERAGGDDFVSELDAPRSDAASGAHTEWTSGSGLRPGTVLMIRFRMPRLPWPFRLLRRRWRRREHPLTTAKVRG